MRKYLLILLFAGILCSYIPKSSVKTFKLTNLKAIESCITTMVRSGYDLVIVIPQTKKLVGKFEGEIHADYNLETEYLLIFKK